MAQTMNPEVKAKWVAALRGGEYKQGRGQLRNARDEFCCLGVLCDIKGKSSWVLHDDDDGPFGYESQSAFDYPPNNVADWAGIDWFHVMVRIDGDAAYLSDHNDKGRTFAEIADAIEEQL